MSVQAKTIQYSILGFLIIFAVLVWVPLFEKRETGKLTVAFLDVGQGDAIFIETPHGHQVLIDGGPDTSVLRELNNVMDFWDRSIDMVIATHPDADHIGGLVPVFNNYQIQYHIESGLPHDTAMYGALYDILTQRDITTMTARSGMRITLDDNIYLDIFSPLTYLPHASPNVSSVVTKLTYGETSFLFPGDIPMEIETILVDKYREDLDVDVLAIPHHGSNTSSSPSFLDATTPEVVVISAEEGNRYGHPHQEVLNRLFERNIPFLATYEEGAVLFESDGAVVVKR